MKRILLFIATNLAIILVASVILHLVGFQGMLQSNNIDLNYAQLAVFALVLGFTGSFISLLLSKPMAKWSMKIEILKPGTMSYNQSHLVKAVQDYSNKAGIEMPEVGIYHSSEVNAFATGAMKNSSLVAFSTGLLENMTQKEIEGVVAHEIAHIKNGDMVTMALLQGVINTFVIFASRVIGHFVDRIILKNESGHGIGYLVSVILLEIILGILASIITMSYSRRREYVADREGAELASKESMVAALRKLQALQPGPLPEQMAAFGISGKVGKLWSSHPPLEDRIKALES